MNKVINVILIILISVFINGCSAGGYNEPSEASQKKLDNQSIIKRSGTNMTGGTQAKNEMQMRDAMNRLRTGGGMLDKSKARGGIFGMGRNEQTIASIGMPINPYLWRASLESIDFIPLSSADPFAGIIITDWYNDEKSPNERCKINIFIKGVELNTNNLKASIFCQESISDQWIDKNIDNNKNISLENVILEKAKKLRLANQ